ncbi:MAG: RdgB/HAM1 family non-canonical purine NTP pyrophosphatase [Gammaproteobacteria bacterium]|nr:RdgB/HAM1 family non-canonical purine NTP pyrophosphatase [Gammaproteobacteria bacterium]
MEEQSLRLKIVLATGNPGKLRELQRMLGERFELIPQTALGVSEVEETGATFAENALLKARHAAAVTGLPAIADDSGLEVDALNGAPGVRSARYAGEGATDADNNQKLLEAMSAIPAEDRTANFRSVVVFVDGGPDSEPLVAEGEWSGQILKVPRGEGGFGYDPLFLDKKSGLTGAELAPDEKNARSHRGQAIKKLCDLLKA